MLGLGLIRMCFMLALLNYHNPAKFKYNFLFFGGIAVQLSFILSGFYMEMVYPKYKNFLSFYFSRIIRIYPCYWINALLGIYLQKKNYIHYYNPINYKVLKPPAIRLIKLANYFLICKDDLRHYYQNKNGTLSFYRTTRDPGVLFDYVINNPSWSMGIEIKFYLLFPLFNKCPSFLLVIMFLLSFFMRSYDYSIKKRKFFPFIHQHFPYEISHLVLGQLAYRCYLILKPSFEKVKNNVFPTIVIATLLIGFDHYFHYLGDYFLHSVFLFLLPYLFFVSKNSKLDRWLGERTYTIYMWHFLIQLLFEKYMFPKHVSTKYYLFVEFGCCFVLSIVFEEFIQKPINNFLKPKYNKNDYIKKENDDKEQADISQLLNDNFVLDGFDDGGKNAKEEDQHLNEGEHILNEGSDFNLVDIQINNKS